MPAKASAAPQANRRQTSRFRSTASKRLELAALTGDEEASDDPTLDAMVTAIGPYLPGIIQTLGLAAAPVNNEDGTVTPGDTQAAKTVLEFMGKALANRGSRRSQEVLERIAKIRKASTMSALEEADIEVPD